MVNRSFKFGRSYARVLARGCNCVIKAKRDCVARKNKHSLSLMISFPLIEYLAKVTKKEQNNDHLNSQAPSADTVAGTVRKKVLPFFTPIITYFPVMSIYNGL